MLLDGNTTKKQHLILLPSMEATNTSFFDNIKVMYPLYMETRVVNANTVAIVLIPDKELAGGGGTEEN